MMLDFLTTAVTHTGRFKVAKLWDRNKVTAALITEASAAVTTVFDFAFRESTFIEFDLTLCTVVCQLFWDPDRWLARSVLTHVNQCGLARHGCTFELMPPD